MDKVRLGTSSCLLGQNVRYDDGHPLNCYLRDTLRLFVNYVPVCPEVEMGLPIPRKTLCLVGESSAARLAATPAKHVNALQHTLGYFKHQLCADEKQEMLERFDQYRRHVMPLSVPISRLKNYVRKYRPAYLDEQVYLHPHPVELHLRTGL